MKRIALLLAVVSLSLGACSNNSSSSSAAGQAVIGTGGGTLRVTSGKLAGTSLTVPPGAVSQDVNFQIFTDLANAIPGLLTVGPAARIEPQGVGTFSPTAQLTLPVNRNALPPGLQLSDFYVQARQSDGTINQLLPKQIDTANALVALDIFAPATYWVAATDLFVASDYMPLADSNTYLYDNGFRLTVSETTTEPNFGGISMFKLEWMTAGITQGIYLNPDPSGAIFQLGEFWTENGPIQEQEKLDSPRLFLDDREVISTSRDQVSTYIGYVPFGEPVPAYTGQSETNAAMVARHSSFPTPLGAFTNVVEVLFTSTWTENPPGPRGASGVSTFHIWLAEGVGIIGYQLDMRPMGLLISGTVDGQPIVAN